MVRNTLTWTTEKPTKPGSYFVFSKDPIVVQIIEDPEGGLMTTEHISVDAYFQATWLGPFTPEHLTGDK